MHIGHSAANTFEVRMRGGHSAANTYVVRMRIGHFVANPFEVSMRIGHSSTNTLGVSMRIGENVGPAVAAVLPPAIAPQQFQENELFAWGWFVCRAMIVVICP